MNFFLLILKIVLVGATWMVSKRLATDSKRLMSLVKASCDMISNSKESSADLVSAMLLLVVIGDAVISLF